MGKLTNVSTPHT